LRHEVIATSICLAILAVMRVVVLGAGFAGLELTTRLSAEFGDEADVVLIDENDAFVFGFSKLDVMFGDSTATAVRHPYRDIVKPGVRFVQARILSIDPTAKHVVTDAGSFDADILVVALGADLDPAATPGLVEGGHEFYTVEGAFELREVLRSFEGGRVVIGVTSAPFKCPPAPSETALMMHDFLMRRGFRERSEISLVIPMSVPIPPSPAASDALLAAFEARDIYWYPDRAVLETDPFRQFAILSDGTEVPYDLFLGIPRHRAPAVVEESGMTVDGWIPVDSLTLETAFPGVYAVGDVTSVGTPKAGVFSEGQATVVAERIGELMRGTAPSATYGGTGICYLAFGRDEVARVDVTFLKGQAPFGGFEEPSRRIAADKIEFGASRIRRWFGA
jgi:sulfide:quinone oxidoreductase